MNPVKAEITDFLSFKYLMFVYEDGIFLIVGKNGSGKSAFASIPLFALYGRARGDFDKELVNEDYIYLDENNERAAKATVVYYFRQNDNVYKIDRSIVKKGSQSLNFFVTANYDADKIKWTDLTRKAGENKRTGKRESGVVRTQQRIIDIVGQDYELFTNSGYFEQSAADKFARGTLEEKDSLIRNAIGADRWLDYSLIITKDLKDIKEKLKKYDVLLKDAGDKVVLKEKLKTCKASLKDKKADIKSLESEIKAQKRTCDRITKTLATAEGKATKVSSIEEQIEQAEKERKRVVKDGTEAKETIERKEKKQTFNDKELTEKHDKVKELTKRRDELSKSEGYSEEEYDRSREDLISITAEIRVMKSTIKDLEKSADLEKIKTLEKDLKEAKADLKGHTKEDLKEAKQELSKTNESIGMLTGQIDAIVKRGNSIAGSECVFNSLCGFDPSPEEKETLRQTLLKEHGKFVDEKKALVKSKKQIEMKIQNIVDDIDESKRIEDEGKRLASLKEDLKKLKESQNNLETLLKRSDVIETETKRLEKLSESANELKSLEREITIRENEVTRLSDEQVDLMDTITQYTGRRTRLLVEWEQKSKEIKKLEEKLEKLEKVDTKSIQKELDAENKDFEEKSKELEGFKDELRKFESEEEILNGLIEKVMKYESETMDLDSRRQVIEYSQTMTKKDIPHLLIANMIPEHRENAREFIDRISRGRYDIDFRMNRDLKNDSKVNAFDTWLTIDGKDLKYALTSGGQRGRGDIAIHLAFIKFGMERQASHQDAIWLDEAGMALDSDGVEAFLEIIKEFKSTYGIKKVFIVTQNTDLARMIDNVIEVEHDGIESRIVA